MFVDKIILNRIGNTGAIMSDFLLTYLSVWIFGNILLDNYMQIAWGSILSAIVFTLSEVIVHRFSGSHTGTITIIFVLIAASHMVRSLRKNRIYWIKIRRSNILMQERPFNYVVLFFVFSLWYVKLYERFFKYINDYCNISTFRQRISTYRHYLTRFPLIKTASYLETVSFKSFNVTTLANAPNTTL